MVMGDNRGCPIRSTEEYSQKLGGEGITIWKDEVFNKKRRNIRKKQVLV
jgi:hypothetical protein